MLQVSRVEGVKSIIDNCPLCGEEHIHGNNHDVSLWRPEHRAAHCEDSGGYYILHTPETEGL
jgi:hypothetical protein